MCTCGDAFRHTAGVFSTVGVLFASGRQVWVPEGRCIPWAHAGQKATVRASAMLASLLSLRVSV